MKSRGHRNQPRIVNLMPQMTPRESARRQHRAVALLAVVQCWLRGIDGVLLERAHLHRLLGIERFSEARVEALEEDLAEFFPFRKSTWDPTIEMWFESLWISRRELAGSPPMTFEMWPSLDGEHLTRGFEGAVPFLADAENYDERLLASYLALLGQGQISPRSLPTLSK